MTRKLLLADDDPHVRRLLRFHLRQTPFEVLDAATGEDAMALLDTHRFDVVVLDLILPQHGGFRICQRIRRDADPQPFVIIITGDDTPETRDMAKEVGADAFLAKPFEPAALIELVNSAMDPRLVDTAGENRPA